MDALLWFLAGVVVGQVALAFALALWVGGAKGGET